MQVSHEGGNVTVLLVYGVARACLQAALTAVAFLPLKKWGPLWGTKKCGVITEPRPNLTALD